MEFFEQSMEVFHEHSCPPVEMLLYNTQNVKISRQAFGGEPCSASSQEGLKRRPWICYIRRKTYYSVVNSTPYPSCYSIRLVQHVHTCKYCGSNPMYRERFVMQFSLQKTVL